MGSARFRACIIMPVPEITPRDANALRLGHPCKAALCLIIARMRRRLRRPIRRAADQSLTKGRCWATDGSALCNNILRELGFATCIVKLIEPIATVRMPISVKPTDDPASLE
jgi:hypothetical protein